MSGSINKVILVGRIGKEPEIRTFQSGARIAKLVVATSSSWKDKTTGEKNEITQWHNVVVSNDGLIRFVENYVNKGDCVYVDGQLETRKFTDKSGAEKYATEVVVKPHRGDIILLSLKRKQQPSEDRSETQRYDDIAF